ncbi:hypothetical protein ACODT3_15685 [Streptomyces sp. 4.24]|uniref:hypothetical protein n=1 Tax=Streptomyces tritrimontium TaxID=3406573 RepID=UPI003BB60B07
MADEDDLKDGEFMGRKAPTDSEYIPRQLIPGRVLASVPEVRQAAEESGRALQIDFLDDAAVLRMLRLRYWDEMKMAGSGCGTAFLVLPVPLILFGYWGGYAQYWESASRLNAYYGVWALSVVVSLLVLARRARLQWGDRPRQKIRARAKEYRRLAHLARDRGADVPDFYPYYGPYPFAANFHPDAEELELPHEK